MSYKRSRNDFETDKTGTQPHKPPYVIYGTPLPPLDSQARDDGSYVPVWQQEVRDERGRKRLHGAFTGGFSAGYFNTAGSKEGWTPSTFVSSRLDRRKDGTSVQQKPEDFMDHEDIEEMEAAQKLQTHSAFAGLGGAQDDWTKQGLMSDLFRGPQDTIGIKLLQRMGWRPGQGLGPKVKRVVRGDEGSTTDNQAEHSFAPDDVPMISFNKKTDKFGLGWTGERRLVSSTESKFGNRVSKVDVSDEDEEESPFQAGRLSRTKSNTKKTSMGIGVLNDTGSDDDDHYELGPRVSYNRVVGGIKKKKKKKKGGLIASSATPRAAVASGFSATKLSNRPSSAALRRCHDGKPALDGFILAAQTLSLDDGAKYAPLPVPENWKSSKLVDVKVQLEAQNFMSNADAAKQSSLQPSERASMLGESALPGKSIFDYISPAARNRLVSATGATLPQGRGEAPPPGFEQTPADRHKSLWDLVPSLERSVAQAALDRGTGGWMPYAEDDKKRARYRSFLQSMTGDRRELPERAAGASTDEWVSEMREFSQAAMVFKPVSGLMASRFTSAKAGADMPKKVTGQLEGHEDAGGLKTSHIDDKQEDPVEQAAKLGMYGPITRSIIDFYPTRLTCKRFGVKPPAHVLHGPETENVRKTKLDVVGKGAMDEMMGQANTSVGTTTLAQADIRVKQEGASPMSAGPAAVDIERNDALEGQRAGEDLFKAIFGSDDED